jgi:ammonium transporter, Amt family
VTLATFAAATMLMYLVKQTGTLRVSEAGELEGLDVHEHGGPAYPDLYNVGIGTEGLNEPSKES